MTIIIITIIWIVCIGARVGKLIKSSLHATIIFIIPLVQYAYTHLSHKFKIDKYVNTKKIRCSVSFLFVNTEEMSSAKQTPARFAR